MLIWFLIDQYIIMTLKSIFQIWFDQFINSNGRELLRQVDIVAFVDINNLHDIPVRTTSVDILNEFAFPMILFISLMSAFWKELSKIRFFSSILTVLFLLFFKIIIMVYDNYTNPDYILVDLDFPMKQAVYYINSLINEIGTSLNIVLVLVLFLVVNKESLFEVLNSKSQSD